MKSNMDGKSVLFIFCPCLWEIKQYKYNKMMHSHPKAYYITKEHTPGKNKIRLEHVFPSKGEVMSAKFNSSDKIVACGYSNGFTRIFNLKEKIMTQEINTAVKQHSPITAVKWRPSSIDQNISSVILLIANANGNLFEYNANDGKELFHLKEEGNQIMAIDYHPEATAFCTGGKDNIIRVYDDHTRQVVVRLEGFKWLKTGHNNRLFAVKYKQDQPSLIASGGWDQNVNIWDTRTKNSEIVLHGPQISGEAIDFQENYVVTGAHRSNDQIQVWDIRQAKVVKTFKWDEAKQNDGRVYGCQFVKSQTGLIMAAGGHDLKFFSMEGEQDATIGLNFFEEDGLLYSCDSANNSLRFICGGKKGEMLYFSSSKQID